MTNDLALLLITSSFPINGDGSEAAGSFVVDLAKEIALSVPVRVVAPGQKKSVERFSANITIYRYSAPSRPLSTLRLWHPLDVIRILRTLFSGRIATFEAADDGKVSAAVALWALPSGYWARSLSKKGKIPYMVWMLGSDIWSLGRIWGVRSLLRKIIRGASRRFADGFQLATDAESIAGIPVDFLPATRAIVSPSNFSPTRGSPPYRLLFLGRWHLNKGVDLLLMALRMLNEEDWSRIDEVRILGGGPMEEFVRGEGATLQKMGHPVYIGNFVKKAEAEAEIANTDYLIIPSRIESIPVVFSDAVKLQRPVIATPVGDFSRLHQQAVFGILAKSASATSICEAIRVAMNTAPDSFRSGVNFHASRFDLGSVAKEVLESTK